MVFDILAVVVLLLSAIYYMRKGFAHSIMSILEWFTALSLSLFFCDDITKILRKSDIGKQLKSYLSDQMGTSTSIDSPAGSVQALFNGWISHDSAYVTEVTPSGVTQIVLAVLSFLVVATLVKVLLILIMRIFRRDKNTGMIAFMDTLGGFTMGFLIGVYYVLLLLLFLMAILALLPAESGEMIQKTLEHSAYTGSMYQHNFLIPLLHNLFL